MANYALPVKYPFVGSSSSQQNVERFVVLGNKEEAK
jgi:hypothetical protein